MAPPHLHVFALVVYATFVAVGPLASSFSPTPSLIRHAQKGASLSSSSARTRQYAEAVGKILGRASDKSQTQYTEEGPEEARPSVPGLPSYLDELSVGDEPIYRLRESIISPDGTVEQQPYAIERVSQTPPIYVLRNFLSEEDAQIIAQSAYLSGQMGQAETYADNGQQARPNSTTAFLSHDVSDNPTPSAPIVDALSDEVGCWLVDADGRNCWAEPMQVVRYTESGRFVLHHDSCNRVITALYFLNGVGGTWFPLADDGRHFPRSRDEAIDACRGAIPGKNGLLVKGIEEEYDMDMEEGYRPSNSEGTKQEEDENNGENDSSVKGRTVHIHPGDAIAFYNLRWMGDIDAERFEELAKQQREAREPIAVPDWRSFHSGLPVESGRSLEKWIANHWLHME